MVESNPIRTHKKLRDKSNTNQGLCLHQTAAVFQLETPNLTQTIGCLESAMRAPTVPNRSPDRGRDSRRNQFLKFLQSNQEPVRQVSRVKLKAPFFNLLLHVEPRCHSGVVVVVAVVIVVVVVVGSGRTWC